MTPSNMTSVEARDRTRMLARVAGPYFLIMGAVLAMRAHDVAALFTHIMDDRPLVLITGAFTLIVGLVVVAAHHHWTGPTAIAISLMGLAAALKGAMLMLAPGVGADITAAFLGTPLFAPLAAAVLVLLGGWLAYAGWIAAPQRTPS